MSKKEISTDNHERPNRVYNGLYGVFKNIFHKCKYNKTTEKEYEIMYSTKWINYQIWWCKCGNYKLEKRCGTLELDDIPEWAQTSRTNGEAKIRII